MVIEYCIFDYYFRCDRVLVHCKNPEKDTVEIHHYKMIESVKESDHK